MSKFWLSALAIALLAGFMAGCHSDGGSSAKAEDAPATQPSRPIPPDSPFAKIKIGMGRDEVFATIGQPTAIGAYATGKAWIPFHYGGDNSRMVARYKGQGTIILSQDSSFTSSYSVIEINYDPNEPGFERHD